MLASSAVEESDEDVSQLAIGCLGVTVLADGAADEKGFVWRETGFDVRLAMFSRLR